MGKTAVSGKQLIALAKALTKLERNIVKAQTTIKQQ